MRRSYFSLAACALLLMGSLAAAEDLNSEPGFVNLDSLKLFEGREPKVEVSLKGALLSVLVGATREDNPELSDMLVKIKAIEVRIFDKGDQKSAADFLAQSSSLAEHLDGDGWERVLRVRDDEDANVLAYLKTGDGRVQGLLVMAMEKEGDAVFVNVVGDMDPEQIGKLGQELGLKPLKKLRLRHKPTKEAKAEQQVEETTEN